jgi:hypothetical protein
MSLGEIVLIFGRQLDHHPRTILAQGAEDLSGHTERREAVMVRLDRLRQGQGDVANFVEGYHGVPVGAWKRLGVVNKDAEGQLADFLAKFTPEICARAGAVIGRMRERLPGAVMPVYDNYNALAVGFGSTQRVSDVIFSIAVFPRWVSLFFFDGVRLEDPKGLLKGTGNRARHIVLVGPEALDDPDVQSLICEALRLAPKPLDPDAPGGLVIKSISAKQRPRRPSFKPAGSAPLPPR